MASQVPTLSTIDAICVYLFIAGTISINLSGQSDLLETSPYVRLITYGRICGPEQLVDVRTNDFEPLDEGR